MSANNDTTKLSMSAGGAKRSRAGSVRGDIEAPDSSIALIPVAVQKHCPDGRTCLTCPRRDDQEDPVAKVVAQLNEDGTVVLMAWGYPPKNGKTVGDFCYDCVRVYLKDGKGIHLSISEWKARLAKKGEKGIAEHHARVIVVSRSID